MNLPVQRGSDIRDGGVFVRRASVTESVAQSANLACHPDDRSLHVSLTSSDGSVGAVVVVTRDGICPLATTLGGGAASTMPAGIMAAHAAPLSAHGAPPAPIRHRLHLRYFHRNASIWDTPAEPWR